MLKLFNYKILLLQNYFALKLLDCETVQLSNSVTAVHINGQICKHVMEQHV